MRVFGVLYGFIAFYVRLINGGAVVLLVVKENDPAVLDRHAMLSKGKVNISDADLLSYGRS